MIKLRVYIQPNASRSAVVGEYNHALKIALKAPPIEGKANKALIAFMAELCGVSKSQVEVVKGLQSRQKTVAIAGIDGVSDELKPYVV